MAKIPHAENAVSQDLAFIVFQKMVTTNVLFFAYRRSGMKIKAIFEGILLGVISAILSYYALISPATVTALTVRRKMPDAWFSGLIVWYAAFIVIGVSIVIGGVACRVVYKHVTGSAPRSARSE